MGDIRMVGFGLVSITLAAACGAASSPQSQESAARAVADSVLAATNSLIAGGNAVDVEATFAHFSTAPEVLVANGARLFSREDLLTAFRNSFAGLQGQDLQLARAEVFPIGEDAAVLMAEGSFSATDTAGVTSPRQAFSWTLVWVREPEGWKIRWAHQSIGPLPAS